ncbi:MAG: type I-U CRISPR-associated protein Csb2 [Verrucomicrobiales bacterium]|nr:type I-U CRISPR-associated protein Csb2 [Verrucomicrobiales bacterium]
MTHLLLTVRFLDDRYHGLLDRGGPPEWPPSPFRLFQALVAGVARRGELVIGMDTPENTNFTDIGKAIGWLQKLGPPVIITPKSKRGQAITRFVPNNDGDKKFDRQERLTAKPTIPTLFLLELDQKPEVHYLWDISQCVDAPIDRVRDAARSLTALGWGIDMAFADAYRADEVRLQSLKGIRWYPKQDAWRNEGMLRTPTYDDTTQECTLCDLRHCHDTAMKRIQHGKPLKTVDKPRVFERVLYTSTERPIGRPYAVFKLLDANEDAYRYPHAKLIHIAGMLRHAAIERMNADPPSWIKDPNWINRVVRGKRDESSADEHRQISYVPLPSIGHEHADAMIRNVMIVAPLGMDRELDYLSERLSGEVLNPKGYAEACESDSKPFISERIELQKFNPPAGKFIDTCYLGRSNVWQTVTPVILDGHNKKSKFGKPEAIARETEKLICKALRHVGIETPCEFTWQSIPFLKNCLSAHKYDRNGRHTGYHRPAHLNSLTAVHVRLTFTHPVPGPITIGAGRHCGFGVMAGIDP